jgi:hypothetical protein
VSFRYPSTAAARQIAMVNARLIKGKESSVRACRNNKAAKDLSAVLLHRGTGAGTWFRDIEYIQGRSVAGQFNPSIFLCSIGTHDPPYKPSLKTL